MAGTNDLIDTVSSYVLQGYDNLKHNVSHYASMSLREWIRIVTIVCAYLLLRPYLTKWAANAQSAQHEKELDAAETIRAAAAAAAGGGGGDGPKKAVISANSLRGQVQVPEDSESEEEEEEEGAGEAGASGANWGKKARRRQRQMIKRIIEADEKLRAETEAYDDEDEKDIEQYLM